MKIIRYINESLLSDDYREIHWTDYWKLYSFFIIAVVIPIVLWLHIR